MKDPYRAGYRFEKKTKEKVKEILNMYKDIKYYIIESRKSRGVADMIVTLYHPQTGRCGYFGIQCRKRRPPFLSIKKIIKTALDTYGLTLVFAWGQDRQVVFSTPLPTLVEQILGV